MKNTIKNWYQKAKSFVNESEFVKKSKHALGTASKITLGGIVAGKLIGATPTFEQIVYDKEGDNVTITNPTTQDTVMANVEDMGWCGYWARSPPEEWNLQSGDTVNIKRKNANGDSALTFRDVTDPTGGNLIWPTYCGGFGVSVKNVVENGIDSVDAKCYKKSGSDTLDGRFAVNDNYFYELYFDGSQLNLQNGDTAVFEVRAPGKSGKTEGEVQHRFIDADTFPSFEPTALDLSLEQMILPDTAQKDSVIVPAIIARNYSALKENPKFYFEIGGVYKDSLEKVLSENGTDTIAFEPCTLSVAQGSYPTKAYSSYGYDINAVNDTLKGSVYVKENIATAEDEIILKRNLRIAPNPCVNDAVVYSDGKFDVKLYNIAGQEVEKASGKDKVSIAYKAPAGVYFAKVYGKDGKAEVKKLIKVK